MLPLFLLTFPGFARMFSCCHACVAGWIHGDMEIIVTVDIWEGYAHALGTTDTLVG